MGCLRKKDSSKTRAPKPPGSPPDGGYGWVITFSCFMLMTHVAFVVSTTGIFLVEFVDHFRVSKTLVSLIGAIQLSSGFLLGTLIGTSVKTWGSRIVTMVSALIMCAGYALSALANSVMLLYLTFGFMASLGMGTYLTTGIIPVQQYFDKRRALAAGIAWIGISAGVFIAPPLIRFLILEYGWRGALIIKGGIHLHGVLYGALLRPLPKPKVPAIVIDKNCNGVKDGATHQQSSIAKEACSRCQRILDFTPLANPAYALYFVAVVLVMAGHILPLAYIPLRCYDLNIDKTKAALLVSISGLCGVCGRLATGVFTNKSTVSRAIVYGICGIITGIITCISISLRRFAFLAVYAAFYGFMSGTYVSVGSTVVVDILGVEKCVSGSGLFVMAFGIAYAATPAFAGYLVDVTAKSWVPFLTFGVAQFVGGLFSLSAHFVHRHRQKVQGITIADVKPQMSMEDLTIPAIYDEEVTGRKGSYLSVDKAHLGVEKA